MNLIFKMSYIFSILLSIILLTGCASGPIFSEVSASKDEAVIYIYRPSKFADSGNAPKIFVNDKEIVTLWNGGYTYVFAKPGKTTIETRRHVLWQAGKETTVTINVEAGKQYYIEFYPFIRDIQPFFNYVQHDSDFSRVPPEYAAKRISECKLIEPDK